MTEFVKGSKGDWNPKISVKKDFIGLKDLVQCTYLKVDFGGLIHRLWSLPEKRKKKIYYNFTIKLYKKNDCWKLEDLSKFPFNFHAFTFISLFSPYDHHHRYNAYFLTSLFLMATNFFYSSLPRNKYHLVLDCILSPLPRNLFSK